MQSQYDSLIENDTWELAYPGRKLVSCKWVFKKKYDREVDQYKARLVVTEYTQKYGVDNDDTFAPLFNHGIIILTVI